MAEKYLAEKRRLKDWLYHKGLLQSDKKTLHCPNPSHNDDHPSAVLYDNPDIPVVYCPVCEKSWTVIDVCGMVEGLSAFKDIIKSVRNTLNITEPTKEQPRDTERKKTISNKPKNRKK